MPLKSFLPKDAEVVKVVKEVGSRFDNYGDERRQTFHIVTYISGGVERVAKLKAQHTLDAFDYVKM